MIKITDKTACLRKQIKLTCDRLMGEVVVATGLASVLIDVA